MNKRTWAIVQPDLAAEAGKDCGDDEVVVLALAKVVVPPLLAPCVVAGAGNFVAVECKLAGGGKGLVGGFPGVGHGCVVIVDGERREERGWRLGRYRSWCWRCCP